MLKDIAKQILRKKYSYLNYPLIVNSYGRSGSTVLTKSVVKSSISASNKTLKNLTNRAISESAWNLNELKLESGIVYKSHDYPPSNYATGNIKMIYTFADPVNVVLSLLRLFEEKGENWIKQHYEHLGVSYINSFDQIIYEDQLQLERHLNSWLNESRIQIAFVRYETMWEYQDEISDYLGFSLDLPTYRERKANKTKESKKIEYIKETYYGLQKKISRLDSFFIKNGSNK